MIKYEKYKDSGIAWIGVIPKHWEVRKIGRIFTKIGSGTTPKSGNEDYYAENGENWLQTGDLNDFYISETSKKITKKALDDHSLRFYPKGSIVMAMYGATIGKLGLLSIATTTNQACCVLSGNKVCHSKYGFNTLLAARTHILTLAYGGGQPNISQDTIKNIKLPVPSIPEQEQIAKYLDWKCGEVDRIIQVRERQIKLLGELRTSVISRAVTRGLDPNAPLEDSGIEWIGQIPEHWEIKRVKFTGKAIIGLTYSPNDIIDNGGSIVLRSTNIQNGVLDLSDKVRVNSSISEKLRIRKGDVLLCSRNGSASLVGKCAYINEDMTGVTWGAFTTVLRSSMRKYLYYALNSDIMKFYLGMFSTSTINQLTTGTLNNMELLIPPTTEQQQIADYLDKKTAEIDSTIEKFKAQIDKIKEYRQALITEVVTGKIDVRGIEIPATTSN